jgi:oxygen-independent coproporphyrinogen-3 oxidase
VNFGIYVHHPWCVRKCAYCAFNVYTTPKPPFEEWRDFVIRDWKEEKEYTIGEAYSVYFGGGTPSLAPVQIISDLITEFAPLKEAEVTLEINPGDLQYSHLEGLRVAGVNRYSVGIQSFNKRFARLLNRSHTVDDNHALLSLFSRFKPKSWSLDLIFGLPDQSLQELNWDIDQALRHNPPHISIYGLTIEEGTPLAQSVQKGVTIPLVEEQWAEQFSCLMNRLSEEGYQQYEISNFARSGHRSKHNEHVWKNGYYVGLGPGAHGFRTTGIRTVQNPRWEDWRQENHIQLERLTIRQSLIDQIITQIRHIDGFSLSILTSSGFHLPKQTLEPWKKNGLIVQKGLQLRLSKEGRFFSDWITQKIIEEIRSIEH